MSTFGRYTGRLGAITAPTRLEYYIAPALYDLLSPNSRGVCLSPMMGGFEAYFDSKIAAIQRMSRSNKAELTTAIADLVEKYTKERAAIERRGNRVKAICLYPALPKAKGKVARAYRRATPIHERFHADMRVLESGLLDRDAFVPRALADLLETFEYGEDAMALSYAAFAPKDDESAAEEVLARLEEYRQSCARSPTDCKAIRANMVEAGADPMNEEHGIPDDWLVRLFKAILKKYPDALAFAADAHKIAAKVKDAEHRRMMDEGGWLMGLRARLRRRR